MIKKIPIKTEESKSFRICVNQITGNEEHEIFSIRKHVPENKVRELLLELIK